MYKHTTGVYSWPQFGRCFRHLLRDQMHLVTH